MINAIRKLVMNWDNAQVVGPKISNMSFFFQLSCRASFMSVSASQHSQEPNWQMEVQVWARTLA